MKTKITLISAAVLCVLASVAQATVYRFEVESEAHRIVSFWRLEDLPTKNNFNGDEDFGQALFARYSGPETSGITIDATAYFVPANPAFSTAFFIEAEGIVDFRYYVRNEGPIPEGAYVTFNSDGSVRDYLSTARLDFDLLRNSPDQLSFSYFPPDNDYSFSVSEVPLPASIWFMGAALFGFGAIRSRATKAV